jgi:DNA-binding PadR family transcriptional regulator
MSPPLRHPLALAVLGLLQERPMHPYDMKSELRARGQDRTFNLSTGSLYDVVRRLEERGWIAGQGSTREGNRPARTVYAHTGQGHDEFVAWVDELVRMPKPEASPFLAAVAYLGVLGPAGARAALVERADRLTEKLASDRDSLAAVLAEHGLPRLFMLEAEAALHLAEAEREWVTATIAEIDAGTLAWPGGDR